MKRIKKMIDNFVFFVFSLTKLNITGATENRSHALLYNVCKGTDLMHILLLYYRFQNLMTLFFPFTED